jgi:hypothetical protein
MPFISGIKTSVNLGVETTEIAFDRNRLQQFLSRTAQWARFTWTIFAAPAPTTKGQKLSHLDETDMRRSMFCRSLVYILVNRVPYRTDVIWTARLAVHFAPLRLAKL